jgi:archaellum component FlaC
MEVEELATIVTEGFQEIAGQFKRVDARFEQVGRRFEQIDGRFEQIDGRFEQIDGRFEQIGRRFEQIDGRFEQIVGRLRHVEGRLTNIEDDVHQTRILVEGLTDDVKQISEGVEMHHAELRRHVEQTDRRFDDIESVFRNYRAARRKRTTARAKPSR